MAAIRTHACLLGCLNGLPDALAGEHPAKEAGVAAVADADRYLGQVDAVVDDSGDLDPCGGGLVGGDRDDADAATAHLCVDRFEVLVKGAVVGGDDRHVAGSPSAS